MGRDGREKMEQEYRVEKAMKVFMQGDVCRRVPLDRHMDGRSDRQSYERGEERCDICRGAPRGTKRRRIVVNNIDYSSEIPDENKGEPASKRQRSEAAREAEDIKSVHS